MSLRYARNTGVHTGAGTPSLGDNFQLYSVWGTAFRYVTGGGATRYASSLAIGTELGWANQGAQIWTWRKCRCDVSKRCPPDTVRPSDICANFTFELSDWPSSALCLWPQPLYDHWFEPIKNRWKVKESQSIGMMRMYGRKILKIRKSR